MRHPHSLARLTAVEMGSMLCVSSAPGFSRGRSLMQPNDMQYMKRDMEPRQPSLPGEPEGKTGTKVGGRGNAEQGRTRVEVLTV